jgi:YHS domain-containing protein
VRVLQFALIVLIIAAVLVPFLRRRRRPAAAPPRPALRDELVKDPVCQTYVVRSRAVPGAGGSPYFCSAECARRWAAESRG